MTQNHKPNQNPTPGTKDRGLQPPRNPPKMPQVTPPKRNG